MWLAQAVMAWLLVALVSAIAAVAWAFAVRYVADQFRRTK